MTTRMRIEHDSLGTRELPVDALYGIHALRASENFSIAGRNVAPTLIRAYGAVKLAAAQTNHQLGFLEQEIFDAIATACHEMLDGLLNDPIIVDALQGGAGTSTNMNVNEVLANRALQIMGKSPGEYECIHPLEHLNLHQSTNDTYPTALRVSAIWRLRELEQVLTRIQETFQEKEKCFQHVVRVGRTQLQDAVLTTMGRTMGAYAEAVNRDRWRVYKCEERLRVINLGGTAIGTGLGAPRRYIFKVSNTLRDITGIGLARAENLQEATQNQDVFAECSGILCACATNLSKIANDLRLLASGPQAGLGELQLPAQQAGSSIMPGKVNPVIPEAACQAAMIVTANHQAITQACASGTLELNPFLPLVADRFLESLHVLIAAVNTLDTRCVRDLEVNEARCNRDVMTATATLTALLPTISYDQASKLATESQETGTPVTQLVIEKGLMSAAELAQAIAPEAVTRLGSPNPPEGERTP